MWLAVAVCARRAAILASQPPEGSVAPARRSARMTAPASAVASAPFWVTRCWASTFPPSTIVPTMARATTIATTMITMAWTLWRRGGHDRNAHERDGRARLAAARRQGVAESDADHGNTRSIGISEVWLIVTEWMTQLRNGAETAESYLTVIAAMQPTCRVGSQSSVVLGGETYETVTLAEVMPR